MSNTIRKRLDAILSWFGEQDNDRFSGDNGNDLMMAGDGSDVFAGGNNANINANEQIWLISQLRSSLLSN